MASNIPATWKRRAPPTPITSPTGSPINSPRHHFNDSKAQLRVDGLEPYILVSAITATASFEVLTQGTFFADGTIYNSAGDAIDWLKVLVLISSSASCFLGVYAVGIFSFTILYSKAALAKEEEEGHELYQQFFNSTAKYRFKAFLSFYWSLLLFIVNPFLFVIGYLPQEIRLPVGIAAAFPIYFCYQDWNEIIAMASIIFTTPATHHSNGSPIKQNFRSGLNSAAVATACH